MKQESQPTARLEARLPNDVHALLKRAAQIQGRTLADLVVTAALEAACRAIEETQIIRVSRHSPPHRELLCGHRGRDRQRCRLLHYVRSQHSACGSSAR